MNIRKKSRMDSIGIITTRDFKKNKPTRKEIGMRLNSLKYTAEIKTIEEIKKASFYREVWYIDNHWYIGYGDY